MRVALIGANGQLGSDLLPRLQAAGHEVVPLRHADLELTDATNVAEALKPLPLDLVINAAAYNLVDRAEDEPDVAYSVNAFGPRNLARVCEAQGWRLLHISTDYVFGGVPEPPARPWTESDVPQPNGGYAISKLAGEHFVQAECSRHFVVRTCGLYGLAALRGAGKGNFVETMLRLGRERRQLRVVDDQRCTPTATSDLADALVRLIATDAFGLYHATNSGSMTWCEFAREIFRLAKLEVEVVPITTAEFGAKAHRPSFSVLDSHKLATVIDEPLADWHEALAGYLASRDKK
ncbi:MAG: dTDP-4-dehydrorhamnose reductase [Planctomycetaceae bacterium]